jgi:hypothetical protein
MPVMFTALPPRCLFSIATLVSLVSVMSVALAQQPVAPSTGDSAIDFILTTTAPAVTQPVTPTTAPASPLVSTAAPATQTRRGTITFSDGSTISGSISTTLDKPLRIWVEEKGHYDDIPFQRITSAEAAIVWERDQQEYQFLTSGSDVKTFTGRTYPARETVYTLTLRDGRRVKGSIVAPLDVRTDDGREKLVVLSKRDKGAVGQSLKDLVYVTKLTLEK